MDNKHLIELINQNKIRYSKLVVPKKKYYNTWWVCWTKTRYPKKTGMFYSWVFVWKEHLYKIQKIRTHKTRKGAEKRAKKLVEKRFERMLISRKRLIRKN